MDLATDSRSKPYNFGTLVTVVSGSYFGVAPNSWEHKYGIKLRNGFKMYESVIRKASYLRAPHFFSGFNLVSVWDEEANCFKRGMLPFHISTSGRQRVTLFDYGTKLTVPNKNIFGLHKSLHPDIIKPRVHICCLKTQDISKKSFLKKIKINDPILMKKTMTLPVSMAVLDQMPFYRDATSKYEIELFKVPDNHSPENIYSDLSNLTPIF